MSSKALVTKSAMLMGTGQSAAAFILTKQICTIATVHSCGCAPSSFLWGGMNGGRNSYENRASKSPDARKLCKMAEWERFELSQPCDSNDLANRPLQPLEYHSVAERVGFEPTVP